MGNAAIVRDASRADRRLLGRQGGAAPRASIRFSMTSNRLFYAVAFVPLVAAAAGLASCSASSAPPSAHDVVAPAPVASRGAAVVASRLHARPEARFDVGRIDGDVPLGHMSLSFRPSPAQQADRDALLAAQQDPTSPSYHRWLTPERYAARFGATPETIANVGAWLRGGGFTVDSVSRAGTRIFFSGTVAHVEQAFSTEIHRYQVDGEERHGLASDPSAPAAIGDLVFGLHGVDDFRAPRRMRLAPGTTGIVDAGGKTIVGHALAPEDVARIYDFERLYAAKPAALDGSGVSIAVIGGSYYNPSDIAAFRKMAGLAPPKISDILVPGTGNREYDEGGMEEASADLEWSGAMAPGASLTFVYSHFTDEDLVGAFRYAIDEALAPIMNVSFVGCEAETSEGMRAELVEAADQANLEGITIAVAAGDSGPASCDVHSNPKVSMASRGISVNLLASIPGVTAVGGTSVSNDDADWASTNDGVLGSAIVPARPASFPLDTAWDDDESPALAALLGLDDSQTLASLAGLSAGGGGASALFDKPVWQQATSMPAADHRTIPDVALTAGGGGVQYAVLMSYTAADGADAANVIGPRVLPVGGTSLSSPVFAGFLAILNQALVANGNLATPGLGNINPQLYALYASNATNKAFRDVVSGTNCVPCKAGSPDCPATPTPPCNAPLHFGYAAGPGYDEVTGLGTIDAANLVSAWESLVPTSMTVDASPATSGHGAPVTFTANVASTGASDAMTGDVTFSDSTGKTLGVAPVTAGKGARGEEGGTAALALESLPLGVDTVFAAYGGDAHYMGSFTRARLPGIWNINDASAALVPEPDAGAATVVVEEVPGTEAPGTEAAGGSVGGSGCEMGAGRERAGALLSFGTGGAVLLVVVTRRRGRRSARVARGCRNGLSGPRRGGG